jgi:hypothetical protein
MSDLVDSCVNRVAGPGADNSGNFAGGNGGLGQFGVGSY